jgi:iron complex transport system ATP-binding protein
MLELKSITVAYGAHVALREVSLCLSSGEVLALIGPNGAGKSTLIRAVSGVLPVRVGGIFSDGVDLAALSTVQRARLLAVVPQARQLGGAFTVEQTVLLGRTAYMNWLGKAGEEDWARVRLAMEQTSTTHLAERRIAELSGGEQQRVLLARALAQDTPILLLDEPTNHLDLQHQASLLSLVRQLARDGGLAVLMAMHDLNQVSMYSDRVVLLVEGCLKAVGEPAQVLNVENIRSAYHTDVQVINHPHNGAPLILPVGGSSHAENGPTE